MSTMPSPVIDLHLRSYDQSRGADRHAFTQLVLPVVGRVALEIDGRHGQVDVQQGAIVAAGIWHSQCSRVTNSALIVDIESVALEKDTWYCLRDHTFLSINPAARKLIEYMAILSRQRALTTPLIEGWIPLLLDTLVLNEIRPSSRLTALVMRVQEDPGRPWSTQSMARLSGLSISRLHAVFQDEFHTSPHAWLLLQRITHACEMLIHSNTSVADIALAAGFSDQSSLTRAMRDTIDATPAAYRQQVRRQIRENMSKNA